MEIGIDQAMMADDKESVEDILRPLAEATVECVYPPQGNSTVGPYHQSFCPGGCNGTAHVPDSRFEALRRGDYRDRLHHFRGRDASLGAIARATVASGFAVRWIHKESDRDLWAVGLVATVAESPGATEGGASIEEAWAKALVAAVAVGDAFLHSLREPMQENR